MDPRRLKTRKFVISSHGGRHRPGCPNVKRLKTKPTIVECGPNELPEGSWSTECCWRYSNTGSFVYGWWYDERQRVIT